MGLPVMSEKSWDKAVAWLGSHVEKLALSSCKQVRQNIINRGDKLSWTASFDGFYLTRGHHSNNSSATLHDFSSDKIAWFAHRTKRRLLANWQGTSAGAEGDMLRAILELRGSSSHRLLWTMIPQEVTLLAMYFLRYK